MKDEINEIQSHSPHYREFWRKLETDINRNPLVKFSETMYKHGSFKNAVFELNLFGSGYPTKKLRDTSKNIQLEFPLQRVLLWKKV